MDLGAFELSRKCGCVVCAYYKDVQWVIGLPGQLNCQKLQSLG